MLLNLNQTFGKLCLTHLLLPININCLCHLDDYWIGGNDILIEGEWRWQSNGTAINPTYWGPGEPSDTLGNEHCIEYKGTRWNDDVCNDVQKYICEK